MMSPEARSKPEAAGVAVGFPVRVGASVMGECRRLRAAKAATSARLPGGLSLNVAHEVPKGTAAPSLTRFPPTAARSVSVSTCVDSCICSDIHRALDIRTSLRAGVPPLRLPCLRTPAGSKCPSLLPIKGGWSSLATAASAGTWQRQAGDSTSARVGRPTNRTQTSGPHVPSARVLPGASRIQPGLKAPCAFNHVSQLALFFV